MERKQEPSDLFDVILPAIFFAIIFSAIICKVISVYA